MINKCQKCGGKVIDGCCIRCGYMINGNVVGTSIHDDFEELRIYNDHFEEILRNEKQSLIFFLGPLYFSYRNKPLIGGITFVIHIFLFLLASTILNPVSKINYFLYLILHFLYLFIERILYATFADQLILLMDKVKIRRMKRKINDNEKYINFLNEHIDKSIFAIFISLLIAICILLFILIVFINYY